MYHLILKCFFKGESGPCTSTTSQTTTNIFTTLNNTTVATTASTAITKGSSPQPITTTNIFTTFSNTYSPQPITTTTYPRTTKNAETVTDTGYSSPATTKSTTQLLQTVKAATNGETPSLIMFNLFFLIHNFDNEIFFLSTFDVKIEISSL